MKKVFLIGGMSECGKSTVGRYLDSLGVKRLKIVTYLRAVAEREQPGCDFKLWNDKAEMDRPEWLRSQFVPEFEKSTDEAGIEFCCLESLYNPDFGAHIRSALGSDRAVIVYVDIPHEVRVRRQMIRENLGSIEEAEAMILPRDEIKKQWDVPGVKRIADVVLDNSGTIEELYGGVHQMLRRYGVNLT